MVISDGGLMSSKILPDFQEFLISRALVDKKHIPFYAR